jgi:hypothetical protein
MDQNPSNNEMRILGEAPSSTFIQIEYAHPLVPAQRAATKCVQAVWLARIIQIVAGMASVTSPSGEKKAGTRG